MSTPAGSAGIVADYDALLLDLDGVVYVGSHAVAHAVTSLRWARQVGVATAYVTNNASRPPSVVAAHLRSFGLDVPDGDVVTSAQAGAREIAARLTAGSRVLAIGGPGVALALSARGLVPVFAAAAQPDAVLMGYGPDVAWRDLAEAAYAVGRGALFVATNTDTTIPTPEGIAPGNGTLVAAVVAATGREPLVAGKPCAPLITESIERLGAQHPLIVGDRLDTDVEAGHRTGLDTLLVLTGVTDVDVLLAAPPAHRPTFVAADLRGLREPASALRIGGSGGHDGLAPLRAACAESWLAADRGRPVPVDDATREELVRAVRGMLAG
jgi:glycerol-1-phosphatase